MTFDYASPTKDGFQEHLKERIAESSHKKMDKKALEKTLVANKDQVAIDIVRSKLNAKSSKKTGGRLDETLIDTPIDGYLDKIKQAK